MKRAILEVMQHQVTQNDIAKALGLTRQTVALVVGKTNSPLRQRLSAETVRRIQEKAEEMGYSVNYGAQMLRKRKSNLIVLMKFSAFGEKSARQAYHLGRLADEMGYEMRVVEAFWWIGSAQSLIEQVMSYRPEGVIMDGALQSPFKAEHVEELKRRGIPIVGFGMNLDGVSIVRHDAKEPIRQITENALRSGRRRLALLLADSDSWQRRQRIEGFQQALQEGGYSPAEIYDLNYTFKKEKKGVQSAILIDSARRLNLALQGFTNEIAAAEQVLSNTVLPDALICVNDEFAAAALKVCSQKEISVPEKVSISGFGNLSFGALSTVSMTSVGEKTEEMCRAVMEMLMQKVRKPDKGQTEAKTQIFPCHVIWRESAPLAEQNSLPVTPISQTHNP